MFRYTRMFDLSRKIQRILVKKEWTISVAESMTGGLVQGSICAIPGASRQFKGGVTAYTIDSKVSILSVNRKHAEEVNCVSEQVAEEMVKGGRTLFNSDICIATTGYAQSSKDYNIEVPFAYVSINICGDIQTHKIVDPRNFGREQMQQHVTIEALTYCLQFMESY